jgi:ABC-type sugar transport system substrate-binding protein
MIERAGGEMTTYDPEADVARQIGIMEDVVAEGEVDGIILMAVGGGLEPVCDRAAEAGIPVFAQNLYVKTPSVTNTTTHFQVEGGRKCGQWVVDKAMETGEHMNVYELWLFMGAEMLVRRHDGFHEIVDQYPELVTVMESPETDAVVDREIEAVTTAFSAHPELNCIWGHGDGGNGAAFGLERINRYFPADHPDHVYFVAFDTIPELMDDLRGTYIDGLADHSPWENSEIGARCLLTYCCLGMPVPAEISLPCPFFTSENCDEGQFGQPMLWGDMLNEYPDYDDWPLMAGLDSYIAVPTVAQKKAGY